MVMKVYSPEFKVDAVALYLSEPGYTFEGVSKEASTGRHCHNAVSPLHAAIYFVPEPEEELTALGLERGPMIYLADRAAPLGSIDAGAVTATFYNFNHEHVRQYIPAAWTVTTPQKVLTARLRGADRTLQRLLGNEALRSPEMTEVAVLALHRHRSLPPRGAAAVCRQRRPPRTRGTAPDPVARRDTVARTPG